MKNTFKYALFGLLALSILPLQASANTEVIMKKSSIRPTDISSMTCDGTDWTDWIAVPSDRSVTFEITYDETAASATTNITMTCEVADDASLTHGAGYDLVILEASGTTGTSTSTVHTWNHAVSADANWVWSVANLPMDHVNCQFTCTAGDVNAVLTVRQKRITP